MTSITNIIYVLLIMYHKKMSLIISKGMACFGYHVLDIKTVCEVDHFALLDWTMILCDIYILCFNSSSVTSGS